MATETFEVHFTTPILDFPGTVAGPRNPNTDSADGLFTSPGHYFQAGSFEEVDYSNIVDAASSGAPGETPGSGAFASIDNEQFRLNMTGLTLNAPSVRLRANQTSTAILPPWEQVVSTSVSVRVVSRDSSPGIENAEYESAHGAPDGVGALVTLPAPTTGFTDRRQLLNLSLSFQNRYEAFASHVAGGFGELHVFRSGPYPWGVHDIAYMALVVTVETLEVETLEPDTVPFRRVFPRDDGLAGGAPRTWPPSKAEQSSNRIELGGGIF